MRKWFKFFIFIVLIALIIYVIHGLVKNDFSLEEFIIEFGMNMLKLGAT